MTGILNFIFVNKILKKNLKILKYVSWLEMLNSKANRLLEIQEKI